MHPGGEVAIWMKSTASVSLGLGSHAHILMLVTDYTAESRLRIFRMALIHIHHSNSSHQQKQRTFSGDQLNGLPF
jgi:hypothetical protein